MQQGAVFEKPNLSVDAWISYLNGKSADINVSPSTQLGVSQKTEELQNLEHQKHEKGRRSSKMSIPERPPSRIKSASNRKMSQEAQKALLDMGVTTDDIEENTEPSQLRFEKGANFESQQLPLNGGLLTAFPATSQDRLSGVSEEDAPLTNSVAENQDLSFSLRTESDSKQKLDLRVNSQSEETSRPEVKPALSDRDRIYNPLEASYRSELRKITSRMGVELDAIQAIQCNHHKKSSKQVLTSSNRNQSKSNLHLTNQELYANLPSCAKCRQQYFSYCLQNSKHETVKRIPPDIGIRNVGQQKNILAFNTSAPRKSFINISGVGNANSDHSSPMRSKSVSPMRYKMRQASGSNNVVRESRNVDRKINYRDTGNRMNSATPVPTKLVDPINNSNAKSQTTTATTTKLHNAKNRTIVIPKIPLANATNSPTNKRRNSAFHLNDPNKQQNGNASSAPKRSNPLNSQKLEKTSAKLKEIERLKTQTNIEKEGSNSKTETQKKVQQFAFYDSRFEGDWQRPWNAEGSKSGFSDKLEPIDESQKQIRDQSITKCKEWLALWFSNQS